ARARYHLQDVKPLEHRVREGERTPLAGIAMSGPEGFGPRPILEGIARLPEAVGGVERVILLRRPLQQVELDEAGHLRQIAVAAEPARLERGFLALAHPEAIHRNEHG